MVKAVPAGSCSAQRGEGVGVEILERKRMMLFAE